MSWPLSSQSSLHLTSDFLEDLNSDLGIYKEPPPKDVISPSYGQRYIPKLLRILSSEESSVEKKLKTLALFLTSIADDRLKAECISCPDGKVFLELLLHPNNDIKTATCKAVSKLFEFTPSREFLYKGGIVQALLNNVGEVPGAVAGCFCSLTKNRDIISTLLKREKTVQNVLVKEITVVDTLHKLLKSDDMEAREYSASSLGALSREDEGVRQVLAIGISSLLDGVKQEESLKFKNACIYTIMQLCHSYDGKVRFKDFCFFLCYFFLFFESPLCAY